MKLHTLADYFPARRDRLLVRALFLAIALLLAPLVAAVTGTVYLFALGIMPLICVIYELYVLPAIFALAVGRP